MYVLFLLFWNIFKENFFLLKFSLLIKWKVILLKIWKVMKWNQIPFNMIMPINFFLSVDTSEFISAVDEY